VTNEEIVIETNMVICKHYLYDILYLAKIWIRVFWCICHTQISKTWFQMLHNLKI